MTAVLFDMNARRRAAARAAPVFDGFDFLIRWAENQILDRLSLIKRHYPRVLVMGGPASPEFLQSLRDTYGAAHITGLDCIARPLNGLDAKAVGEEDFLPFGSAQFDLVIGLMSLHKVNDLPGALIQIRRTLKPDGLFLAGMAGGETLHELRHVMTEAEIEIKGGLSPRIYPFATKPDMGGLLQRAQFALPVVDSEILHVTYTDMFALVRDLRGMGGGNIITARARTNPGRALFFRAAELYARKFSDTDGRIEATAEIIFALGWAPHESQQQPLKPGSAQSRLADALDTTETPAGEIAGS